jgi:hypothetical protein
VADGLDVTRVSATQVRVGAGTAVDRDGREIVLAEARTYALATAGGNSDVYLTVAYQEVFDAADHDTLSGLDEFTRTTERPLVRDGTAAPPNDGSAILLARIRLNAAGGIDPTGAIDTAVRTVASARLAPGAVTVAQLGDGAVQSAKLANYAVGSAKLDGFARGQHGVFLETFEELPSDWTAVDGTGVESIVASGEAGGKALRVVGFRWRVFPQNIPFDPSKLYRIRGRFRPIAHSSDPVKENAYIGVEGVAADGVTLVNTAGQNTTSGQHYVCVAGLNTNAQPLGTWLEFTGWFRGHAAVGSGGASPSPTAPGQLHANVRYFRPLFILGFNGGTGTAEIDSIAIDVFDEDAAVRTYSGLNADGTVALNKVVTNSIAAGAISTAKLADGSVATAKLASGAVTAGQLQDGSVGRSKMVDLAVDTSKLADGAVTLAKLASNSVDGSKIVSGSVGTSHLANGSVLGQHIANGAISATKLQSGSVGITALAVEAGTFDGQFTISANGTSIKTIISDGTPIHRCVFVSIVVITPNTEVSWEEVASTGPTGIFSRYIRVKNLSGVTVTYNFKTFQLPL